MNGDDQVGRCIAKAAALLQAECKLTDGCEGSETGPGLCRLPPWKIARVASFVDANLAGTIRIEEIAALARLSRSYFSRAFRSTMGEAPHAYIVRRRIERAQHMILLTDKPLCEIALDCGLGDQSHLTRLFHRLVGMSPGMWRRLQDGAERDFVTPRLLHETPLPRVIDKPAKVPRQRLRRPYLVVPPPDNSPSAVNDRGYQCQSSRC